MRRISFIAPLLVITVTHLTQAAPTSQPLLPPTIARSDIAAAQDRFERAYVAHPPADDASRARIHRAYDDAMVLYLNAKHAQAIQALNELTDSLQPAPPSLAQRLIESLQVRVAPPVAMRQRPSILRVRVAPMYIIPIESSIELRLVIHTDAPNPTTVLDVPVRIDPGEAAVTMTRAQPRAAMGKYVIELTGPDGAKLAMQRWTVVETPLDVLRAMNDRRLQDLRPVAEPLRQALITCVARNTLLSDHPDENIPAQFLPEPLDLSRDVQSEVEWLTMGKDPYAGKTGEYFRAILAGAMEFPARVYAPAQAKDNKPLPLVIAMHDSIGDESWFMRCYGNGQLKSLADKHGFIVIAPSTHWVIRNAASLDSMIDAMSFDYSIDKSRVYLVGHSLGAMAASAMASNEPDKIAGMALFAGGGFANAHRLPPTLVFQGDADQFIPLPPVQAAVDQARASGLPVELQTLKGGGHTLIVDDQLPAAIDWLMKQKTSR